MRAKAFLVLVVMVVLAMVLVAGPAGAKRPCHTLPEDDPDYCPPTTTTTTTAAPDDVAAGTVCGPEEEPADLTWDSKGDFTFTLSGKNDGACINVVTETAGAWVVTISGSGANSLGVIPRDSIGPGDSCGGYLLRNASNIYGTHTLGYDGVIPATTINACDVYHPDNYFAEWVDPALVPTEVCAATDDELGCKVIGELDVTHPFSLQVFMRGRDGHTTTFHVDLP